MIRVLSISFGEYTKVTYMKHNGRCDETYQLKTKDLYRPEEAIDAIDADDSHVFHVNDLQAKGVTQ